MSTQRMAEEQIRRAQARGELDNLKGEGKPLPDQPAGDFAQAAGFRIMSEAGAVPEEVRLRKAVEAKMAQLRDTTEPQAHRRLLSELGDLQMRLAIQEEARRKFGL